jgi:magnesium transporter
MTAVLFEHQSHLEAVDFLRSRVISREAQTKLFRRAAQAIRSMRERLEHFQHRLQELQQQHLMDQQELTASRMRVLTVVSVIFLPLTLIAGIYGMNFQNMPELDEHYAYYIVVSVMVLLGAGMLTLFYRRGWFRR